MIYSTNRTESLGDVTINANESYFGNGYLDFVQECYEDELAIFENIIMADSKECTIKESSEDLAALNEAFTEQAKAKLAQMMQKFIEWIESVKKSMLKKFDTEYVKAIGFTVKDLSAKFDKLDKEKAVFSGKVLDSSYPSSIDKDIVNSIDDCKKLVTGQPSKDDVAKIEAALKKVKETNKSDLDKSLKELKDVNAKTVFEDQIKIINTTKDFISNLRSGLDGVKATANKIYKDAKKADKSAADKDASALKLQAASTYRSLVVEAVKLIMGLTRATIHKALSTMIAIIKQNKTAVKEGVEVEDIDLVDITTEAAIYEMEQLLDDFTEGKDCDCCDDKEKDSEDDSDDEEE